MPQFLEKKLEKEYKGMPKKERDQAIFGTMNKEGFMHGSKETKKGEKAEEKHEHKEKHKKVDEKKKEIAKRMK